MNVIEQYWARVDDMLHKFNMSVAQLSRETNIPYESFKAWRSRKRIPDPESLIKISNQLEVTIDYLLTGTSIENEIPEFRAVLDNPSLRKMVRKCVDNPRLIIAFEIFTGESFDNRNMNLDKKSGS